MYALRPIPPEDEISESVLANRPHFEVKLAVGTRDLPMNRFVTITCESLVRNPVAVIGRLYEQLEMGEFGTVRERLSFAPVATKNKRCLGADRWRATRLCEGYGRRIRRLTFTERGDT